MPRYGRGCHISTLIMEPINFWKNADLFRKKNIFLANKIDNLEYLKKISKRCQWLFKSLRHFLRILNIEFNNFGPIWLWVSDWAEVSHTNVPEPSVDGHHHPLITRFHPTSGPHDLYLDLPIGAFPWSLKMGDQPYVTLCYNVHSVR